MNKGHIEQVGTPHEVYQHPASRFVADFIGSANFVEAKVSEGDSEGEMIPVRMLNEDFNVHYAGLPVKAGDTVQIVLRPESIRLADSGDVEAEVISSTYMGAVQEYVVRAGDKELETEEYNPEGKRIYGREIKYGSAFSGTRSTPWRTERNLDTRHGYLSIEERIIIRRHFNEKYLEEGGSCRSCRRHGSQFHRLRRGKESGSSGGEKGIKRNHRIHGGRRTVCESGCQRI